MDGNNQDKDPYAEMPVKDFSYTSSPAIKKPPKNSPSKWLIAIVLAALIIIVAVVLILSLHHKKASPNKSSTSSSSTHTQTPPSTFGLQFNPSTSYSSVNFNLNVSYPKNWSINETTNSLTILSPPTQIKNAQGKTVSGKIQVAVYNQNQIPSAFGTNQSVAVLNSMKVTYSNPSQDQAAQTYLTFIQYPTTTVSGGLDAIYVTGNYGYNKYQNVPSSDISNIDPLVVISFFACQNSLCTQTSNLTISSTEWSNSGFSSLIDNIVKSFSFN